MKYLFLIFFFTAGFSTFTNASNPDDYNTYLTDQTNDDLKMLLDDEAFWTSKLKKSPDNFTYLSKLSSNLSRQFKVTGDIEKLAAAESHLLKANELTNYKKSSLLRSLAHLSVTQHKFQRGLDLLIKAVYNGDDLQQTHKMLFDVYLELGDDACAEEYLNSLTNKNEFDYLIRLSKWNDHNGNLDGAIQHLEAARDLVERSNNKPLMQWSYANLADYYGHAGRIQDSYDHYLKALKLDPNNSYALKGIAWILYSHENKPEEAMRILKNIDQRQQSPSYKLLMAEIAEYQGNKKASDKYIADFLMEVQKPEYGVMYNSYLIELYSEDDTKKSTALTLAKQEVKERPTAEAYSLLAWAQLQSGLKEKALQTVDYQVYGKSSEPELAYKMAEIFKANDRKIQLEYLKSELEGTGYELGPLREKAIAQL